MGCGECRMHACSCRCPNNYAEPRHVFVCSGCGGSIHEGEQYMDVLGEQFCESCIYKMTKEAEYEE